MKSRLLETLERQAAEATDKVDWARAVCKIAVHEARQGSESNARAQIAAVRSAFGNELHIDVASWVMLAEGVLHFSNEEMRLSQDRLRRAYGLAVALKNESARPSCAAWMALIEFNAADYDQMCAHLVEVLNDASKDDHQARGRACLVLADALHFSGTYAEARPWYEKTRLHATAEGDQAMLSAMLYNVTAFRVAKLRLADAFGQASQEESSRALMEANSSVSYDFATGAKSFDTFWRLLNGQLLTVQGKYADAARLLDSVELSSSMAKDVPMVQVDKAWCYLNTDRRSESAAFAHDAECSLNKLEEPDDRAFVLKRLSQVAEAMGDLERSFRLNTDAMSALHIHHEVQTKLLSKVQAVVMACPNK